MIWYPLKLIFSESNITLLNLISPFKNHLLGIGKLSHHSFNMQMLIISCHEPFSNYLENVLLGKRQLANKFSASKVDCDGNTLLSAKIELKFSLFFLKINNVLVKTFALVN